MDAFRYPEEQTVTGRALGAFLRGEHLTVLDGWKRFGTSALTQVVQRLREYGWSIRCESREVLTSDGGRSAVVGVYSLPDDVIAAAGDPGRCFAEDALRAECERRAA